MDDTFSYRSYETFVGISPPILGSLRRQRYYEVDIICGTVSFFDEKRLSYNFKANHWDRY